MNSDGSNYSRNKPTNNPNPRLLTNYLENIATNLMNEKVLVKVETF